MTSCATPSCEETYLHDTLSYCLECIEGLLEIKRGAIKDYKQYKKSKQKYTRFQKALIGYTDAEEKCNCMPTEKQMLRTRRKNAHFVDEAEETINLEHLKKETEGLYTNYNEAIKRLQNDYNYTLNINKY